MSEAAKYLLSGLDGVYLCTHPIYIHFKVLHLSANLSLIAQVETPLTDHIIGYYTVYKKLTRSCQNYDMKKQVSNTLRSLPAYCFHDEVVFPVGFYLDRLLVGIVVEHVGPRDHLWITERCKTSRTNLRGRSKQRNCFLEPYII